MAKRGSDAIGSAEVQAMDEDTISDEEGVTDGQMKALLRILKQDHRQGRKEAMQRMHEVSGQLAGFRQEVTHQFADVQTKFNKSDNRMNLIEKRLDRVEQGDTSSVGSGGARSSTGGAPRLVQNPYSKGDGQGGLPPRSKRREVVLDFPLEADDGEG